MVTVKDILCAEKAPKTASIPCPVTQASTCWSASMTINRLNPRHAVPNPAWASPALRMESPAHNSGSRGQTKRINKPIARQKDGAGINAKFEHHHETKDLSASPAGNRQLQVDTAIRLDDLWRLWRLWRTYFPAPSLAMECTNDAQQITSRTPNHAGNWPASSSASSPRKNCRTTGHQGRSAKTQTAAKNHSSFSEGTRAGVQTSFQEHWASNDLSSDAS